MSSLTPEQIRTGVSNRRNKVLAEQLDYDELRENVISHSLTRTAHRLEADHEQLVVHKRAQATPGRVQQIATGQLQMRPANPAITEYVKGAPVALPTPGGSE